MTNDDVTGLADPAQFAGYTGGADRPDLDCWCTMACASKFHRPQLPIGSTDPAGIRDVVLESAITTIMDFEDSVAAVDAEDKVLGYRNWFGAQKGRSGRRGQQGRKVLRRVLSGDRTYTAPDGSGSDPARPQPAVRPQCRSPDDQ